LSDFDATTATETFVDNNNGTVTDPDLGLIWMSCSLGQTLVTHSCICDADELSGQQALQFAHGYEFAEPV
jgi:hypothetical protein